MGKWVVPMLLASVALAQPVLLRNRDIQKTLPGCGDAKNGCARVDLKWVEVFSGPEPARELMNRAIGRCPAQPQDNPPATPEQAVRQFFAAYDERPVGGPDSGWYLDRVVQPLRNTPHVLSIKCWESSYAGGAHGIETTTYLNFDPQSGALLRLSDFLKPGTMPELTGIAEVYFRRKRKIAPDADLKAAGFVFFKGDCFALNENFGIGPTSLVFTFNNYEVAPYAWGPTTFEIPFSAIRGLLRTGRGL